MGIRNDTHFWSSTEYGPLYWGNFNPNPLGAYYRYLDNNNSNVLRLNKHLL
jgi:hypothetical protein